MLHPCLHTPVNTRQEERHCSDILPVPFMSMLAHVQFTMQQSTMPLNIPQPLKPIRETHSKGSNCIMPCGELLSAHASTPFPWGDWVQIRPCHWHPITASIRMTLEKNSDPLSPSVLKPGFHSL